MGFTSGRGVVVQVVVHGVHIFARRLHFGHFTAADHEPFAEGEGGTVKLRGLEVALETLFDSQISEIRMVSSVTVGVRVWAVGLIGLEKDLGFGQG